MLLTAEKLADADWPRESIDEIFYMPDPSVRPDILHAVSYLGRTRKIDCIIPLDEFDIETAAALREHMRVPGMGETTARYFRDKLAMRMRARDKNVPVPEFVEVINYDRLREFMDRVPPPWVLKPRFSASAIGIKKIHAAAELWPLLDALGDEQSFHLLEQFIPGEIFHVDAVVSETEVVFAEAHQYGKPPFTIMHGGGIFTTRTLPRDGAEAMALRQLNQQVVQGLGLRHGVTHTEFIRAEADGAWYFLESAARVGGANIAELVEAATGVNLWTEWAKVEIAGPGVLHQVTPARQLYAGIIISLAKQESPDTSIFDAPEIVWRMNKPFHVGLIIAAPDPARVRALLDAYTELIYRDFYTSAPPPDKPTS
ncbi:MAG: acetyl-CoA carboxylase biotin carboxylase subunit family protein [Blastocatellia bacterium]